MKKSLLLSLISLLTLHTALLAQYKHYLPVNPNADQPTRALLERLYQTVDDGKIISGLHHNQLDMPNYMKDLNRINEAVEGAIPMVWGGDVAWDADKVVQMAIDHHQRGYLISITWHAARPFDRGALKDVFGNKRVINIKE